MSGIVDFRGSTAEFKREMRKKSQCRMSNPCNVSNTFRETREYAERSH